MLDLLESLEAWPLLIVAVVVFGFLPGVILRFILLAFRRSDPRRAEILAELRAVPRWERPFWVFEQLEVALFEGVLERIKSRLRTRRSPRLKEVGSVVFTKPFDRVTSLSKKPYPQGTTGIITRLHTDLLGEISSVDVRLGDGNFVRQVPVDFFRP